MLEVHYEDLKQYDIKSMPPITTENKKQADTLGWLLMSVGVNEITEKTVDEIIFRTKFLDFVHGSSYFVGNPSDTDLRQLFKNHIGLRIVITNRGLKDISTRRKFMVNQLDNIEERIMKQINN
jgi:hypothetical protein